MADAPAHTETTVDALLEQRARYEEWLAKLDAAGNRAPDAVRERVRADYRNRLAQVLEQLRGHAATISSDLERLRGERAELERRRDAAQEAVAEAEVRHAVGEYGDEEWRRISDEQNATLANVGSELERVTAEIERLSEVERLVSGGPARPVHTPAQPAERTESATPSAAEPESGTAGAAGAAGFVAPSYEPEPPAEPEPVADMPGTSAAATPPAEDEMAFLQSITGGVESPPPPAAPAPAAPEPAAAPAPAEPAGAAKTLRCAECGTLNRPTEWYCERCGAELAAL